MEFTKALIRASQPESPNERDFNISDTGLDRHRSHIYSDGWRTANFLANPSIQYVHSANKVPNPDLVIGQGVKLWQEGDVMASRAKFDVDGEGDTVNVLAKKVLYKVDNGFLRATSVGFDPLKHGRGIEKNGEDPDRWYHREQDLLEWSVVPVPSNPRALMRNLEEWTDFIDNEGLKGDDLDHFLRSGIQDAPLLYYVDGLREQDIRVPAPVHFHFDMPTIKDALNKAEKNGQPDLQDKPDVSNEFLADLEIRHRYLKSKRV